MEIVFNMLMEYQTELPIEEVAKYLLPISATLMCLIYVASIYWLQSGLQELEFSKSLLEDISSQLTLASLYLENTVK